MSSLYEKYFIFILGSKSQFNSQKVKAIFLKKNGWQNGFKLSEIIIYAFHFICRPMGNL